MEIKSTPFGKLPDGRQVELFTLENDNNIRIKIMTYGGIITSIEMPDKKGKTENVACGFDKLEDYLQEYYLNNYPYFGAIIGRFGNRISGGNLEIEGKHYKLAVNNGPNHLHGGSIGFDRRLWNARPVKEENKVGVELSYNSPDMEENYPGNLQVKCTYTLNNDNELEIEYFAQTDKTTVINLTNHTYFNLNGEKDNVLDHELKLSASEMTEMIDQIPTGKIISTKNSPYDFSAFKKFSMHIDELPMGYDDNFVLDNEKGTLTYAGSLREEERGRQIDVYTTQPGIQVYTGYWNPEMEIDGEKKSGRFSGVALETQHYPDSVHHDNFPSTILKPGEEYHEKTIYRFINQ